MARTFIDDCAFWATQIHDAAAGSVQEITIDDYGRDIQAYRIKFASGHDITALSSRPSNFRGKRGVAIIDEAAFHEDLPGLIKAAMAMTMWGGKIHIISTHNGAESEFARLVEDIRAGRLPYSLHRTTITEALADGLYRAICQKTGEIWSPQAERRWLSTLLQQYGDAADEELHCVPSQGSGVFLPAALIEARMKDGIPVFRATGQPRIRVLEALEGQLEPALQNHLLVNPLRMSFAGVDFGRSGDITVIWVLQIDEDLTRRTSFVVELRNVEYDQQRELLFFILDRLPHFVFCAMDGTGNGGYLAEAAGLRYSLQTDQRPGRIEAVMMSLEWYRMAMPKMKARFEDRQIELPKNADILSDFRLIRMERGIARVPDIRTKEVGTGEQRHGDSAIACCLAIYASQMDGAIAYGYQPVVPSRSSREFAARDDDRIGGRAIFRKGAW